MLRRAFYSTLLVGLRVAVLAGLVTLVSGPVCAQSLSESALKVAYIFNFAKFVEWPAGHIEERTKFGICHGGTTGALFRELGALEDKIVKSKPIEVLRVSDAAKLEKCAVLVLGEGLAVTTRQALLRTAEANAVLTVADVDVPTAGSVFGLFQSGDRVAFEVNLESARAAGLRVPSQLARLGKVVGTPR